MRHTIAYEGALTPSEHFILEGAIKFPDEGVPVTEGFFYNTTPLGIATDLQRGEDGEITVEIDADLTHLIGYEVGASFSGNDLCLESNDNVVVVKDITIRAVALTGQTPWSLNNQGLKTIGGR